MKVGDKVTWFHKPHLCNHASNSNVRAAFTATGTITMLYETVMGGRKKIPVAQIKVDPAPWWDSLGKSTTVTGVHNLEKIPTVKDWIKSCSK